MVVFGEGVLRPLSCRERVKRVQEWVGIRHEDWTFQSGRSSMWTQRKQWNWFWKTIKTQFKILSIALDWFVKNVPTIVHGHLGYGSVCAWWVPRYRMEVHENWCLEVLFHFFSYLKEEQMGSLNLWWQCETWFYHFTQNELWCSGHIRLHWEPQNVKCVIMFEGSGMCILCCRSHHMNICCDMPSWLH